jgi:hypothetical protein
LAWDFDTFDPDLKTLSSPSPPPAVDLPGRKGGLGGGSLTGPSNADGMVACVWAMASIYNNATSGGHNFMCGAARPVWRPIWVGRHTN